MGIRKIKKGAAMLTRGKIAKAPLRVGVYRIGAHPDFLAMKKPLPS